MTTEIVLMPVTPERYAVRLGDVVIVDSSRDPEHAAARALLARGITGRMTTLDASGNPRMHFDIETAAGHSVTEGDRGLQLQRWKADPRWSLAA